MKEVSVVANPDGTAVVASLLSKSLHRGCKTTLRREDGEKSASGGGRGVHPEKKRKKETVCLLFTQ